MRASPVNEHDEKELLALPHLNAKLVKDILDKRPFLSMAALHALLSDSLNTEQRSLRCWKDTSR